MHSFDYLNRHLVWVEDRIGYRFSDRRLLRLAFVHRSFVNEHRGLVSGHNERLEFLGDAVLDLIVSEFLYDYLPDRSEGDLSYLRSVLVDSSSCVLYVKKIELHPFLLVGKGEGQNLGRGREMILANLFEAIIGALYVDGGLVASKSFFLQHFTSHLTSVIDRPQRNWKTDLQQWCQMKYGVLPTYSVFKEEGPDHRKTFYVQVGLKERVLGHGTGSSKKEGEQLAAKGALEWLELGEHGKGKNHMGM